MEEREKITGIISQIVFSNEENGYTVAQIDADEFDFIAVGTMYNVSQGEKVTVVGTWVEHATYGEQFKVEMYEKHLPTTREEILKYLSSGIIKGVRKGLAQRIVEAFGEESLNVIKESPLRLATINGISEKKAMIIGESFETQLGTSELFMFLQKYSISANTCMKIYKLHKISSKEVILNNPYILCTSDYTVSFKKADTIAMENNISKDDPKRICAGIIYMLHYSLQFGHTYLPLDLLISYSAELLKLDSAKIPEHIDYLTKTLTLIREKGEDNDNIYLYEYYNYEKYVSRKIVELSKTTYDNKDVNIEKHIEFAQIKSGITFAPLQLDAIKCAIRESVMVITGGPGTGKTTIINAIIDIMKSMRQKVVLTAPTGRASKRMSEVCSMEAKTIHRLLEVNFSDTEDLNCTKDETDPIDADCIIVDEVSMVDISLMYALLNATKPGTRLILVGDVNQLPSVGAGNVLKDIIESKVISVITLNEIFRQAKLSMIVKNAHDINEGKYPLVNTENSDFYFSYKTRAQDGLGYICELVSKRLKDKYGYEPFDIQVLSPSKKGICGVNNLNNVLQNLLNPPSKNKKEKSHIDIVFREGDKVMQIKNNYDIEWTSLMDNSVGLGVFNGDIGFVGEIDHDFHTLTVIYDDKKVLYSFKDLSELTLAYAITVHKSQGSEFPVIIMPMFPISSMLLTRNLLYTGITRAKELVVLVGENQVLEKMIDNNKESKRYSALTQKLIKENENGDFKLSF